MTAAKTRPVLVDAAAMLADGGEVSRRGLDGAADELHLAAAALNLMKIYRAAATS